MPKDKQWTEKNGAMPPGVYPDSKRKITTVIREKMAGQAKLLALTYYLSIFEGSTNVLRTIAFSFQNSIPAYDMWSGRTDGSPASSLGWPEE